MCRPYCVTRLHRGVELPLHQVGIEPDHIARHAEPHHGVGGRAASRVVLTADLAPGPEHLPAGIVPGLVYTGDISHLVQDLNRLSGQSLTLHIIKL